MGYKGMPQLGFWTAHFGLVLECCIPELRVTGCGLENWSIVIAEFGLRILDWSTEQQVT